MENERKEIWMCARCNISNLDRMFPCPRGSCDSKMAGTLLISFQTGDMKFLKK